MIAHSPVPAEDTRTTGDGSTEGPKLERRLSQRKELQEKKIEGNTERKKKDGENKGWRES